MCYLSAVSKICVWRMGGCGGEDFFKANGRIYTVGMLNGPQTQRYNETAVYTRKAALWVLKIVTWNNLYL